MHNSYATNEQYTDHPTVLVQAQTSQKIVHNP
jgi:hypothetical protein